MRDQDIREMLEAAERAGVAAHDPNDRDRAAEELRATDKALRAAVARWQNAPAPEWPRLPIQDRRPNRWGFWLAWAPLALCLLMATLVVFGARVDATEQGWSLSFGGERVEESLDLETVQAYLDQALRQHQARTAAQLNLAMSDFRDRQDAKLEIALTRLTAGVEQSRAADIKQVMNQWRIQRADDLALMDEKIKILLKRQDQNSDNLFSLAAYVQRAAENRQ